MLHLVLQALFRVSSQQESYDGQYCVMFLLTVVGLYSIGKFRDDLLEEIEIALDTRALLDNITNQVKISIKKAIALLLTVKSNGIQPAPSVLRQSSKQNSADNGKYDQGIIEKFVFLASRTEHFKLTS